MSWMGLDAHFLKRLHRTGMKSGQKADVVVRFRRITVVEEFAHDRSDAVRPGGQVGSVGHPKNTELRANPENKGGLQALHPTSQIPDFEESPGINRAFPY